MLCRKLFYLMAFSFACVLMSILPQVVSAAPVFSPVPANITPEEYKMVTLSRTAYTGTVTQFGYREFDAIANPTYSCPLTTLTAYNHSVPSSSPQYIYYDFDTQNGIGLCAVEVVSGSPTSVLKWNSAGIAQKIEGLHMKSINFVPPGGSPSVAVNTISPSTIYPINSLTTGVTRIHSPLIGFNKLPNLLPVTYTRPTGRPALGDPVTHYMYKFEEDPMYCNALNDGSQILRYEPKNWFAKLVNFIFPFANAQSMGQIDPYSVALPFASSITIPSNGLMNLCLIASNSDRSEHQDPANSRKIIWKQDSTAPIVSISTPSVGNTVNSGNIQFTLNDNFGVGFTGSTLNNISVKYYNSTLGLGSTPVATGNATCTVLNADYRYTCSYNQVLANGSYLVTVTASDDFSNSVTYPQTGLYFTVNTTLLSGIQKMLVTDYTLSANTITFSWIVPSSGAPTSYTFYYEAMSASPSAGVWLNKLNSTPIAASPAANNCMIPSMVSGVSIMSCTFTLANTPLGSNLGNTYYYRIAGTGGAQSEIAFMYGDLTDTAGPVNGPYGAYPDYKVTYRDAWKLKSLVDQNIVSALPVFLQLATDVISNVNNPPNDAGNTLLIPIPDGGFANNSDAWRIKYYVDSPTISLPNY